MKNKRGFTLVEIIAVIGILVVVGSIFTINMIKSLNKSNEEEKTNIETQITSAALSYATVNKEEISDLYGGYAYIDVTVGELKDYGLLSEDIKDPETGKEIPDTNVIRLTLVNGEISAEYEPDDNKEQYAIKVEDLYVEYKADYEGEWCNPTNEFEGIGNSWGIYNVNSGSYIDNTGNNVSVTSCNVNPKVAGTYSIEYEYYFPKESSDSKRTITRNVYVSSSSDDIKSFNVVINNSKEIIINSAEIPIIINEVKRNGTTNKLEGNIKYENSTYTIVVNNKFTDYEIKDFDVTKVTTNSTASVNKKSTNSDGSYPTKASANYSVTNVLSTIVNEDDSCDKNNYYCDGSIYVSYYGKIFQIYYLNGKKFKIIYEGQQNTLTQVAYAQLGTCYNNGCCNGGRYYYKSLGDYNGTYNSSLATLSKTGFQQGLEYPLMETNLDEFMSQMVAKNNGSAALKYITTQSYNGRTFKTLLLTANEWNYINKKSNNYIKGNGNFWLVDFSRLSIATYNYNKGLDDGYVYAKAVDSTGNVVEKGASKNKNSSGVNAHGVKDVETDKLYLRPTIQLNNPLITSGDGSYNNPYIIG